jgi:hypothetical protein
MFFCITHRPAVGPNKPPIYWGLGEISPGVKRPRSEAYHSPSCSAKVKNVGAIPPLPHVCSWHSTYLSNAKHYHLIKFLIDFM